MVRSRESTPWKEASEHHVNPSPLRVRVHVPSLLQHSFCQARHGPEMAQTVDWACRPEPTTLDIIYYNTLQPSPTFFQPQVQQGQQNGHLVVKSVLQAFVW